MSNEVKKPELSVVRSLDYARKQKKNARYASETWTLDHVDASARRTIHKIIDWLDEQDERQERQGDALRNILIVLKEMQTEISVLKEKLNK